MKIGNTLYVINRDDWRLWLAKNHDKKKEIWLIYSFKIKVTDVKVYRIPVNPELANLGLRRIAMLDKMVENKDMSFKRFLYVIESFKISYTLKYFAQKLFSLVLSSFL